MHTLNSDIRKSGIPMVGDIPWGTNFCQFFQTKKDLLDIFVPYVRAGLENNELCVWVTSRTLGAEDVKKALKKAVPHFQKYVMSGQIQLVPSSRCHEEGGKSGQGVVSMLDKSVSGGFDGLRLACSAPAPGAGGKSSIFYGADAVEGYNAIAVFAYPRDKFDAAGLMKVVKNHRFALVRNEDRWEVIESSEARTVRDALKRSEEKLHSLFSNMSEGFAYHRIVLDKNGKPCNYVFLEINEAFKTCEPLKGLVDLNTALDKVIINMKTVIDENHALIICEDLPTVMADAVQMVQIFQNLIANALKFRGTEPPRIHISADHDENEWVFRVRDNGIGIDPKYYDKLFVIFKRLHGRDEYPGTGIGLAICKKIAERHGGRIWVESEEAKGATFCFTIKKHPTPP